MEEVVFHRYFTLSRKDLPDNISMVYLKARRNSGKPLKSDKSIRAGYGSVCKRKQVAEADAEFDKIQITIFEVNEYQERLVV